MASSASNFEGQHSLLQLQRMWRGLIAFSRSRTILGLGFGLLPVALVLHELGLLTSSGLARHGAEAAFVGAMAFLALTTFSHEIRISRRLALASLIPWILAVGWLVYYQSGGSAWTALVPLVGLTTWFLIWRRVQEPEWFPKAERRRS